MADRPSDEEFAQLAARHSLYPDGEGEQPRRDRIPPLQAQGVDDEPSLAYHALRVMRAPDTQCYRASYGRDVYANDRMNTIVRTHENKPERSTVHYNDALHHVENPRTAIQRLQKSWERESAENFTMPIRTGGSQALIDDRTSLPATLDPIQARVISGLQQGAPPMTDSRAAVTMAASGTLGGKTRMSDQQSGPAKTDAAGESQGRLETMQKDLTAYKARHWHDPAGIKAEEAKFETARKSMGNSGPVESAEKTTSQEQGIGPRR